MHDEKFLIFLTRLGDRSAADSLIRQYYDDIYSFVYYRAFDKQDAMDITQEVFLRMLRSISQFDHKKASFKTWLYHVAASVIIDQNRKSSRLSASLDIDGLQLTDDNDFTLSLENADLARSVLKALEDEDDITQQIFQLKIFSCQTSAHIANELGLPESTVKSRYYRLVKKLNDKLEASLK